MSKKKHHGHYCCVCGQHKANEAFSGSGHAHHICRKCAALPVAERNASIEVNRIYGMAFRQLSKTEITWLRKKMNDTDPIISTAAREAHSIKFPHYERNAFKKGLTAFSLEFYINGEVWDEFGDELSVRMRFFMDDSGEVRRIDYNASKSEQETVVNIEKHIARKYHKALIHQDDILFWHKDLSDVDTANDPYLDILPEYRPDYGFVEYDEDYEDQKENETGLENREPVWMVRVKLSNGEESVQTFYNNTYSQQIMLFWELMDWFEPEEVFEEDELDEMLDENEIYDELLKCR